jgi:glycosyltransferase involved in cell wall biosynthesis
MHISFITSHFPFYDAKSVGGIGTSIKNLSLELVNLGHKVTVFVYGQNNDEKFIEDGINLVKIKNVKFKGLSWYFTRKKIQQTIIAAHNISKIDIIEVPDWEGISSFIELPFPIVVRLNGSDTYFCHLDSRKVKWINKFHEKRALQKANGHLSVSRYTADMTNKLFNLNNEYVIIPNGVDITVFKKEKEEFNDMNTFKGKKILYFGGIIRKKGLLEIPLYFNKIIKEIPNCQLVLIGKDMPDKKTGNISTLSMMQSVFSNAAMSNVIFLGSIPHQEIKEHIKEATVCIFPSFAEALPVSWLEAMALEKAVVASDIGWSNEIIDNRVNGFKVDPKKHDAFADHIIELLQNDELRKKIESNAREKMVSEFATSVTALRTLEFYNQIIKKNA